MTQAFEFLACIAWSTYLSCYYHVGYLFTLLRGFYRITHIFGAQLEAAVELRQSKGVDWHYFCATCTEIRVRRNFGVTSKINDFFSVQFTLRSVHKWVKLFSDAFLTISNPKKNPSKNLSTLLVLHCSVRLWTFYPATRDHARMWHACQDCQAMMAVSFTQPQWTPFNCPHCKWTDWWWIATWRFIVLQKLS